MKDRENKKFGQLLTYLWASLLEDVENDDLVLKSSNPFPSEQPLIPSDYPLSHPAVLDGISDLESAEWFGLENPNIFSVESLGQSNSGLCSFDENVELLDRPNIYN